MTDAERHAVDDLAALPASLAPAFIVRSCTGFETTDSAFVDASHARRRPRPSPHDCGETIRLEPAAGGVAQVSCRDAVTSLLLCASWLARVRRGVSLVDSFCNANPANTIRAWLPGRDDHGEPLRAWQAQRRRPEARGMAGDRTGRSGRRGFRVRSRRARRVLSHRSADAQSSKPTQLPAHQQDPARAGCCCASVRAFLLTLALFTGALVAGAGAYPETRRILGGGCWRRFSFSSRQRLALAVHPAHRHAPRETQRLPRPDFTEGVPEQARTCHCPHAANFRGWSGECSRAPGSARTVQSRSSIHLPS